MAGEGDDVGKWVGVDVLEIDGADGSKGWTSHGETHEGMGVVDKISPVVLEWIKVSYQGIWVCL